MVRNSMVLLEIGREYVEIAGIKWATMNVGAKKPTDFGHYFQWGDVRRYKDEQVGSSKKLFNWESYKFAEDSDRSFTKYNGSDNKRVLDPIDDPVTMCWGDGWRLPTMEEFVALGNATNSRWTTNYKRSGVAGLVLTDKTDKSNELFFPACGRCSDGSVDGMGLDGSYWSSSLHSIYVQRTYRLYFYCHNVIWQHNGYRCRGYSVRGVLGEKT